MTKKFRNNLHSEAVDPSASLLAEAVRALSAGRLVVIPTDTVYGVAADPNISGAEELIYRAKSRDRGKPIPLLAAGISAIEKFGAVLNAAERQLAEVFWPGPLTMILEVGDRREGFRIPDHEIAITILRSAGGILRVTSANVSGGPPAMTVEEARQYLGRSVAVYVDSGRAPGGVPSTVMECVKPEKSGGSYGVRIIRQGAISEEELAEALSTLI